MFEILILTLILLMKIPDHEHVFLFNEKITVHCLFSHDSDEETGERPKPSNREVRYGAPTTKPFIPIISVLTYIASNGFKIYFDLFELNLALAFIFMLNYLNIDYM